MRSGGQGFSRHPDVLEVTDEATRRPTSKPLSVSPCARPHGPTFGCRTPRARSGPPRTSAPTTHPAPTRPGARRTRAALGAGRPQAGGSQFIATGAGGHPAGQHGARGDTKAWRRLRVGLHAHQSWTVLFPGWGWPGRCRTPRAGAARILRAPGRQEVGDIGRRAFVADEVADEAARKPASKPFSVSPCLL